MGRRALLRIVLLSLLEVSLRGFASPRIEMEPAWSGYFRQDAPTEVRVRLDAGQGRAAAGHWDLTVVDTSEPSIVQERRHLAAGTTVTIPLVRVASGRLNLKLTREGKSGVAITRILHAVPRGRRIVAIAGPLPDFSPSPNMQLIYLPPRALPEFADSFAVINLLVIDSTAYTRLTSLQRVALLRYVRGCGGIILYGFGPPAARSLRNIAGCRGATVFRAASQAEVASHISGFKARPADLPDARELEALLDTHAGSTLTFVVILLLVYLALMTAIALRGAGTLPLSLMPVSVAAVMLLSWTGASEGGGHRVTWADTTSGSASARYTSVLRIPGRDLGSTRFITNGSSGWAVPIEAPPPVRLERRVDGSTSYVIHTHLLNPVDFEMRGSLRVGPTLQLTMHDGRPTVLNGTRRFSTPASLAFNDRKYRLPPLPPGGSWQPTKAAEQKWSGAPADRLFREKSLSARVALLVRFDDSTPFSGLGGQDSFMMVRL